MIQDQIPPALIQALGPLANQAWVGVLSAAVIGGGHLALKILQFKQNGNGHGNGNGHTRPAHMSPTDVNLITSTINGGFRDLRIELQADIRRVADAQESLAAYTMGVIKSLEAQARETKE